MRKRSKNTWFILSPSEKKELIIGTAGLMGINPGIIEKDIWVVAVLQEIFHSEKYRDQFVFKGGTSLSKVFNVIHRFSEDIDLIMNWELIGYNKEKDPWENRSKTQQERFNKTMHSLADEYLVKEFTPWLQEKLVALDTRVVSVVPIGEGKIQIYYPTFFPAPYVRETVLLEIGPLASWIPSISQTIQTYVANSYPNVMHEEPTLITVTRAERTFWEKVTIAHQIAYSKNVPPQRYSRHYYDIYMLIKSGICKNLLSNMNLLDSVARFKDRFYPSKKARYDLAKPGTLRLIPDINIQHKLQEDYSNMQIMFFKTPPTWEEIMSELKKLETLINMAKPNPKIITIL